MTGLRSDEKGHGTAARRAREAALVAGDDEVARDAAVRELAASLTLHATRLDKLAQLRPQVGRCTLAAASWARGAAA